MNSEVISALIVLINFATGIFTSKIGNLIILMFSLVQN